MNIAIDGPAGAGKAQSHVVWQRKKAISMWIPVRCIEQSVCIL